MPGTFVNDILELAVAIELECAAVYEVFARRFADDEDLVCFWKLYAEAERYHAAGIRIHQATFGTDASPKDRFPSEAEASRLFLDRLRTWREEFTQRPPTRMEAFAVARQIEANTAELHGRTQFFEIYPRFRELFDRMAAEDRSHREMLNDAERRFTGAGASAP